MTQQESGAAVSIQEFPSIVVQFFERAPQPLLAGVQGHLGLSVRYLRRKPGRGLAVIYDASALNGLRGSSRSTPERWVSVTLGEAALAGTKIRFAARQAQEAVLKVQAPGILQVADLGLLVQAFPAYYGLPALAASCTTARDGPLFSALEAAETAEWGFGSWPPTGSTGTETYAPRRRSI